MTAISDDDEVLDISESITMQNNAPFYGNVFDWRDYTKILEECFNAIKDSTSTRQIVLETWLLVDYAIRELLSNLWRLKQFNSEDGDFDLRYELLPTFERCTKLLERVLSIQRSLEEYPDPDIHSVKMPGRFLYFYEKSYPDEFERFLQIEQAYYRKYYPQLATSEHNASPLTATSTTFMPPGRRYCVNKEWVEALRDLDGDWFRLARRLNKARNVAAHSYDTNKILSAFGYAGPNAADQTKRECMEMLDKLLGVVQKPVRKNPES
ncbi:MAG: hypothetical protein HZC38_20360 [Chloroflexi bacterium]|nr:hypothetical protein [Chloroflexota bacterium]